MASAFFGPARIVKVKRPDRAVDAGHRLQHQRPVALAPVLCQGDFALDQILLGPDGLALVDFDRCRAGEAAADIGRFIVSLVEAPPPGMTAANARTACLAGYAEVQGETDGNRPYYVSRKDVPLNASCRAQAYELAGQFGSLPIRAILTSPLSRAWQTAQPLAGRLGLPMSVEATLIEVDFGALALVGHLWSNRMLWGVLSGLSFEDTLQHRSYTPETGSVASIPMPTG